MEFSRGFPRVASGLGSAQRLVLLLSLLTLLPVFCRPAPAAAQIAPQIVNGAPEFAEATTGALLEGTNPATALIVCSAVLIGCDTAITAGHCFNTNPTLRRTLYFQHAGFFTIESAVRHPVYAAYYDDGIGDFFQVTRQEDIALIKLETIVPGIQPARINTVATPPPGTAGHTVGFGRDPLTEVSSSQQNMGIKRSGSMTLAACQDPTLAPYDVLCWDPSEVIGPPGEEVSTCNVDSGGPLFIDQGGVRMVAGLTKGAIMPMAKCTPPVEAFDTNVHRHHAWIAQTAAELGAVDLDVTQCEQAWHVEEDAVAQTCLGLPWGPGEGTRICGFQGQLSTTLTQQLHAFQVPASSDSLRVSMNGISRVSNPVDVSLYVRAGAPPTTSVYDCAGVATGNFATCEFDNPQSGLWYALAVREAGTVTYQIVATEFAPPPPDGDGDGAADPFDNCLSVPNANQKDLDGDSCGDLCDGDFNNNGAVESTDFSLFKAAYLTAEGQPGYDPLADMDCNGAVDAMDFNVLKMGYGGVPGPSGLPPAPPACP